MTETVCLPCGPILGSDIRIDTVLLQRIIDGPCPIYVEVRGRETAPALVLLLGLGMQLDEWPRPFLDKLARHFRVVCIENRDMGRSGRCGPDKNAQDAALGGHASQVAYSLFDMRDDVMRVTRELNLPRFAVVGFSMGGMIAQLVAAKAGDRLTAFAQICSSAGEAEAPIPAVTMKRFERVAKGFETDAEMVAHLADDLIWCAAPSPVSPSEAVDLATAMQKSGFTTGGYGRQLSAITSSGDRTEYLQRITAPSLVIGAEQDRCILPESSHRAHALIERAELKMFSHTGHSLEAYILDDLEMWLLGALGLSP
ncbi:alpha/beta fold hydrolase [Donghicola eburneus]|uniref:Putative alpha/beta hydrolase n=1 Tax=Donghicola eburneus TaxID=393278 RepID=A0A1M4N2I6_9RHOB|nr:alpha/beta hydrolase [Donghicola eburneus]SCM67266.1 putative alpha/beta hydrolase [Donghicola eburneus]SFQ00776.1 Pimeloyl-ACP methyl ester carboxylesterase [Donghicola eburneus]